MMSMSNDPATPLVVDVVAYVTELTKKVVKRVLASIFVRLILFINLLFNTKI